MNRYGQNVKRKLKAGHTRWWFISNRIFTLQILTVKPCDSVLVRDGISSDRYIYKEKTILTRTYPTYRKAQRKMLQLQQELLQPT